MVGTFAEATAIGGLPVPIAAIALPRPAARCFSDLESKNPNRLHLIPFRFARTRAPARRTRFSPDSPRTRERLAVGGVFGSWESARSVSDRNYNLCGSFCC